MIRISSEYNFFYEIIAGRARRTKYIYILWSTHKKQTNGFIVTPHKNSKTKKSIILFILGPYY